MGLAAELKVPESVLSVGEEIGITFVHIGLNWEEFQTVFKFERKRRHITMKRFGTLAILIGLTALAAVIPAAAQVNVTFQAPATFYAGGARMPAGAYTARQMGEGNTDALVIENSTGTHSAIVEFQPSTKTTSGQPQVLFNRYGTTDYLEAILTSSGNSVDIMPGIAEKIAAKKATAQPHSVPAKAK